jgi:phosphoribosylformylglycinamidine synthase subunit PurQ / glutaminase
VRFGVVQFPGSCDERDALRAAQLVGEAELLWHADRDLRGVDAVIVPGGFSYGDYLRAGAIARFSPVMSAVVEWAREGGLVLGICNGFQVLCEARLLPGALLPNANLHFTCRQVALEVVNGETPFTCACPAAGDAGTDSSVTRLSVPAKHSWGRYWADEATLSAIERSGQVVLRYAAGENFNGSAADVAGVCNEQRNVLGLMPHPEHAVDALTGSADGLCIFESMRASAERAGARGPVGADA